MTHRSLSRCALALVLAAGTLGLAACGSGSPSGASAPTAGAGPTTGTLDDQPGGTGAAGPGPDNGAGGGAEGGQSGADTSPPPPDVAPAAEDCVSYDPANLSVVVSGDAWLLRDGGHAMKLFDTQADAEDARRVARNWSRLCFIGRSNTESDRYRYIITYFTQPSGLPLGLAPVTMDCVSYNSDDLDIYQGPAEPADPDDDSWALYSGPIPLLFLASQADALRAQVVASGYTRLCVIGAGNDRPDPFRYRMTWWRP